MEVRTITAGCECTICTSCNREALHLASIPVAYDNDISSACFQQRHDPAHEPNLVFKASRIDLWASGSSSSKGLVLEVLGGTTHIISSVLGSSCTHIAFLHKLDIAPFQAVKGSKQFRSTVPRVIPMAPELLSCMQDQSDVLEQKRVQIFPAVDWPVP